MNDALNTAETAETRFNRRFLAWFAVGLVSAAFCYIAAITFLPLPDKNQTTANTVLGFLLGTLLGTLITFFFGSNKSSQTKDATIAAIATAPVAPAPPDPGVVLTPAPGAKTTVTTSPENPT
jgi:lipopolysaccharide export LptBFGC system permease protein LptF